ncbi:hypothetical protein HDK64DRAFT_254647 [Phyllosticta capitalensis]|uniref:Uncharacterized protein n=1 Tax=Phyllosticta capitalensis TaxID=121624 RepID=A0ABR1YGJ9_9PEZI
MDARAEDTAVTGFVKMSESAADLDAEDMAVCGERDCRGSEVGLDADAGELAGRETHLHESEVVIDVDWEMSSAMEVDGQDDYKVEVAARWNLSPATKMDDQEDSGLETAASRKLSTAMEMDCCEYSEMKVVARQKMSSAKEMDGQEYSEARLAGCRVMSRAMETQGWDSLDTGMDVLRELPYCFARLMGEPPAFGEMGGFDNGVGVGVGACREMSCAIEMGDDEDSLVIIAAR